MAIAAKSKELISRPILYIRENAWIQPIVLVGFIFAIIASLSPITSLVNDMKNYFSNKTVGQTVTLDNLNKKINDDKTGKEWIFYIAQDSCGHCTEYKPVITKYLSSTSEKKIFVLNLTKNSNDKFKDKTITDDKMETLRDKISRTFPGQPIQGGEAYKEVTTPTTVVVKNGVFVRAYTGPLGTGGGYKDFLDFVNKTGEWRHYEPKNTYNL